MDPAAMLVNEAVATGRLDPTCTMHGRKLSEHACLYCCICFEDITEETAWQDEAGQKWDVCRPCGEKEAVVRAQTCLVCGLAGGHNGLPCPRMEPRV